MEIVGKIKEFTPIESGTSSNGPWQKRQVVIVTLDQDPVYIAFTAMGRRLEELNAHNPGDVVRIRFGVTSRKVNERWFTDAQLWQIQNV